MNLKTFVAESMPAALVQVKHAFGTDAVILHTRTYKRGGILGFGAKTVVEITAARASETGHARRPRRPVAAERPAPQRQPRQVEAQSQTAGDLIRRTYLAAQAEAKQAAAAAAPSHVMSQGGTLIAERPATASPPAAIAAPQATPSHAPPPSRPAPSLKPMQQDDLTEEMRLVKRMVGKMMRQQRESATTSRGKQRAGANPDLPDKLFDQYLGLLQQEVAEELAEEVMQEVRASLLPEDMSDEVKVKKAVGAAISKHVPADDGPSLAGPTKDGRPRTIALIGPTGVGKTTTIAKLAANFKLRERKKVGLITIDTYRIAAVDQLRTYANIIGVPLHVVTQPSGMADALAKTADCDVVLIDTAGRSQRDDPKLEQLNQFIAACDPHEVHLVLSSTCTQSAIFDVIDRFSRTRVDRILFTKLDEAVTFGVLLNVARKVKKRLSYLTTGQEVPHDIELGRSDRLAALVLGEGL
ncbi:MAG: flagellar biosynthesis protein FlhF [Phycisphaeraceae bacterium]